MCARFWLCELLAVSGGGGAIQSNPLLRARRLAGRLAGSPQPLLPEASDKARRGGGSGNAEQAALVLLLLLLLAATAYLALGSSGSGGGGAPPPLTKLTQAPRDGNLNMGKVEPEAGAHIELSTKVLHVERSTAAQKLHELSAACQKLCLRSSLRADVGGHYQRMRAKSSTFVKYEESLFLWHYADVENGVGMWILGENPGSQDGVAFIASFAHTPCEIFHESARAQWMVEPKEHTESESQSTGRAKMSHFVADPDFSLSCDGNDARVPPVQLQTGLAEQGHVMLPTGLCVKEASGACDVSKSAVQMPLLGWSMSHVRPDDDIPALVKAAFDAGYRLFDVTNKGAAVAEREGAQQARVRTKQRQHFSEEEWEVELETQLGKAMSEHSIPRESVFISTKLHGLQHGYAEVLHELDESVKRLGTNYIDLVMLDGLDCVDTGAALHFGCHGAWRRSWRALEKLHGLGIVRAIGLSNVDWHDLFIVNQHASVPISVIQIRADAFVNNDKVVEKAREMGAVVQAHSVMGGVYQNLLGKNIVLENSLLRQMSRKLEITPQQLTLRHALSAGMAVIAGSRDAEHIAENAKLFFKLPPLALKKMDAMKKRAARGRGDTAAEADDFNLENPGVSW